MDKWKAALQTSEFWMAIAAGVTHVLVTQGLISKEVEGFVLGALAYVLGRIVSKLAKPGAVPFQALVGLVGLLALAGPAQAEDVSLLHKDRLAFGLGANYDWWGGDPAPALVREFSASAHAAYVLTEHVGLRVAASHGFANKATTLDPELRWRLDLVGADMALAVGYGYLWGPDDRLPEFRHEWTAGAYYARPLWRSATAGLGVQYRVDSKLYRTQLGVRVPIFVGGDR